MVQIAGKYQHVKNENFVEYLVTLGIPEDKAKLLANVTICDASNKDKFLVAVQNPLSKTVSHLRPYPF
jgi:hypothetical protein